MKSPIPPAALNQHIAILGKTGSGKTFAAKGIVEGLLSAGRQVCIIDPTAAWWGLRLGRDGKCSGFDRVILLGGERGDIGLSERSGAAVARLVTEQGASVVIDTSAFTVGEQTRWFIDFAQSLYSTIRNPLHLVIDEAHNFMPQGRIISPDAGKMLHVGNRLMSGGRSRGIRAMIITQRPQKLHHDSLSCADTLIAMRVLDPRDRAAVREWVDGAGDPAHAKEVLASLAEMPRGEGWVWYPEGRHIERVKFPPISTYDSSATPVGDKSAPSPKEIDLTAVRAALAEAAKEAEANDPKILRAKIAELEQQIRTTSSQKPDERSIKSAVEAALEHERRRLAAEYAYREKEFRAAVDAYQTRMARIATIAGENGVSLPPKAWVNITKETRPDDATHEATVFHREPLPKPRVEGDSNLSALERSLLTVLAQYPAGLTKTAACMYAGYKPSGGVSTAWSRFAQSEWITRTADGVRITDAGITALGDYEPLPTGQALREMWIAKSSPLEAALLTQLFARHPHGGSKTEICDAAGYRPSGGVSTAWGKFNTLGWIQRTANGVRAADMWFD